MRLRVYGEEGNSFKSSDSNGRFADFDSFEAVPSGVRAAAISCAFSTPVVVNGYRLGTHMSPICATVQVNAIGNRVEFTAPTVETALAVWNDHAAGMGNWLQEALRPAATIGVRIRVYGSADNALLPKVGLDGCAYAEFDDFDAVLPALLASGFTYTVSSATPPNNYQLSEYDIKQSPTANAAVASVVATGDYIRVSSTDLSFAYTAWGAYMAALTPGSDFAYEAHQEFTQLRFNVKRAERV